MCSEWVFFFQIGEKKRRSGKEVGLRGGQEAVEDVKRRGAVVEAEAMG